MKAYVVARGGEASDNACQGWTEGKTGGMMIRMFAGRKAVCWGAALVAACGAFGQTPAPAVNGIHVEISGLRSDKGQMLCALFSSADAFPTKADKAVAR